MTAHIMAQAPNPGQYSGVPAATYSGSKIDSVNLSNGALSFNVPLFSYPQKGGKATLSYSLTGNLSTQFAPGSKFCTQGGNPTCTITYKMTTPALPGPQIVFDQRMSLGFDSPMGSSVDTYDYDGNSVVYNTNLYLSYNYSASDTHNNTHYLGFDSSHQDMTVLRSSDGSGLYAILPTSTTFENPRGGNDAGPTLGTLYDSSGTRYDTDGTITDSNGNVVAHPDSAGGIGVTDSFGKELMILTATATETQLHQCPNLGLPNQPLTGASVYSFAGPTDSGGRINLIVCYTAFNIHTDLLGGPAGQDATDSIPDPSNPDGPFITETYKNFFDNSGGIQSIVYPDGSYWGFTYDAAASNDLNTVAYGDVTSVHLPSGATIHYDYELNQSCLNGSPDFHGWENSNLIPYIPFIRQATGRTITGVANSPQAWGYVYNDSAIHTITTEYRPDGNYTIHTFTGAGQGLPSCSANETNTKDYQVDANGQNPTLIRNVDSAYITNTNPASFGAIPSLQGASPTTSFLHTQITTVTGATPTTTTYTYDSGFQGNQPVGIFNNNTGGNYQWSAGINYFQNIGQYKGVTTCASDSQGNCLTGSGAVSTSKSTNYWYEDHSSYLNQGSSSLPENLISLPETITVTGTGGNSVTTTYVYDSPSSGPTGVHGNATSVTVSGPQGGTSVVSTNFDSNGQAIAVTKNGVQTSLTYGDSASPFPTVATKPSVNGVTLSDTYAWDPNTSAMTSWTDENGVQTSYTYGGPLGQLSLIDRAIGTPVESETQIDTTNPNVTVQKVDQKVKGDGLEVTTTTRDGLNRVVSVQDPAMNSVDTVYDLVGNVQSVSNPHASAPSPTDGITSYAYDALGRKLLQCQPDDSTSHAVCNSGTVGNSYQQWSYNGNSTTFYDENRHAWTDTSDSLGRLVSVTEPNGGVTNYGYDGLGNLLSVNQPGASGDTARAPRSFTYDSLSRLITAFNPETGTICYGTWSGSNCTGGYDANGNLVAKTDARNISISYSYDALNRLTSKTYSDSTPPVNYSYDTPCVRSYCIGRLGVASVGGANPYTIYYPVYDALGRTQGTDGFGPNATGDGLNPSFGGGGSVYDLAGHVIQYGFIAGFGYFITRDAAGHAISASSGLTTGSDGNGNSGTVIFENATYTPLGTPSTRLFGNGLLETKTYDKRGRQTSVIQSMTGSSVGYGNMTNYDVAGNVTSVADSVNGNWTYGYDQLNRLHTASSDSGLNLDWEYDSFGNRRSQTSTGTGSAPQSNIGYSGNNNRADSSSGISYDAAGNVIVDSLGQTYTYDAEERISSMNPSAGGTVTYKYDPYGNLLYLSGPSGAQLIWRDEEGRPASITRVVSGAAPFGNFQAYVDGEDIGRWYNTLFDWYGKDAVGTVRYRSWGVGDINIGVTPYLYSPGSTSLPFGDGLNAVGDDPIHFADKERDLDSGNDYFGARYYASSMGRFMSPDWADKPEAVPYSSLSDPQSLNLYQYVRNNPLSMLDPDGHGWWSDFGNGLANSTYRPLGQAIAHPITTLQGLGSAIAHPIATAEAMGSSIKSTSVSVVQGDGTAIGTAVGTAAMFFVPGGEEADAGEGLSKLSLLSDDANVVRGGLPENIPNGTGVTIGADGTFNGVSVNSANGKSVADLSSGIPNGKVSTTTVGDVRAAGGDVVPSPTRGNPDHCTMCGITPQQAKDIMKTIPNPSKQP